MAVYLSFQYSKYTLPQAQFNEQYLIQMKSKEPTCSINKPNSSKVFCCTANCQQPAFGCSIECIDHTHVSDQQLKTWKNFRGVIMPLVNKDISEEHTRALQRQSKDLTELLSYIEKLRCENEFAIVKLQAELRMSEEVERVLTLIRTDNTDKVTGGDMCRLISSIKDKELYVNGAEVDRKIQQRLENVDRAIQNVRETIKVLQPVKEFDLYEQLASPFLKEIASIQQQKFDIEWEIKKLIDRISKQQQRMKSQRANRIFNKEDQIKKIKSKIKDVSEQDILKIEAVLTTAQSKQQLILEGNEKIIETIKNLKAELQAIMGINLNIEKTINSIMNIKLKQINSLEEIMMGNQLMDVCEMIFNTQNEEVTRRFNQVKNLKQRKAQRLIALQNMEHQTNIKNDK